jgi:hypothetical protein
MTPLSACCYEVVRISCPLSIDDERMNSIDRELIRASTENNVPEVRRRLSVGGADVNARNRDYSTPLHLACYRGHVQVVNELLNYGTDIEATETFSKQYDSALRDLRRPFARCKGVAEWWCEHSRSQQWRESSCSLCSD